MIQKRRTSPIKDNSILLLLLLLVVVVVVVVVVVFVITFMQDIYNYIPEANHISAVYSAAAVRYLQFVLHVMLFPMLNVLYFDMTTFRSMCAVRSMAVFCSYLISCFPGVFLRCFLNDGSSCPYYRWNYFYFFRSTWALFYFKVFIFYGRLSLFINHIIFSCNFNIY